MTATDTAEAVWLPPASEFPNCVRLLADLRFQSALLLPHPLDQALTAEGAAAVDRSGELIRLTLALGWEDAVADAMAGLPVPS